MKFINRVILGLILILTAGCIGENIKETVKNSRIAIKPNDVAKFKKEYESVNGTKSKSGKTHFAVSIPTDSRIIYANEQDILKLQNGIVLFGFPTCPWCRNAVEPILEFAKEENANIYYLNTYNIREKKEFKDGNIITTREGSTGYKAILDKFKDILNPYPGLKSDSIKSISSPTLLFIEKGEGVYKVASTVDSHKKPYEKLTVKQREELKQRYRNYFEGNIQSK